MNRVQGRSLFFFRKWYFDAQTDDGMFLFAYFAPMTLFGSKSAELVVSLYPPEGGELRRSFHLPGAGLSIADDDSAAEFGSGKLSVSRSGASFGFALDDTSLDLEYTAAAPAWVPVLPGGDPGVLLAMNNRRLTWTVPVPHARITGSARIGSRTIAITGLGYHDFVRTDIPPWSLPLRELLWGRALGEATAIIWNRPRFEIGGKRTAVGLGWMMNADGTMESFSHVDATFAEERDHPATRDRYPASIDLNMSDDGGKKIVAHIRDTRLLLGERVADVQKFRGGLERWLYRRFTNDPVEYKLLSSATLPGLERPIPAAHEWILWGKR